VILLLGCTAVQIANAKFLQTHTGTAYTEFRHTEVSAREFPSSAEEGWPRHQKENSAATFDGADGVVLVKRMHDFLTNTTPSARLWSLRGILTSRPPKRFVDLDPSSAAEEGWCWSKGCMILTQHHPVCAAEVASRRS
jgi:hypothetical protein